MHFARLYADHGPTLNLLTHGSGAGFLRDVPVQGHVHLCAEMLFNCWYLATMPIGACLHHLGLLVDGDPAFEVFKQMQAAVSDATSVYLEEVKKIPKRQL